MTKSKLGMKTPESLPIIKTKSGKDLRIQSLGILSLGIPSVEIPLGIRSIRI
jgi:hypothetical protein